MVANITRHKEAEEKIRQLNETLEKRVRERTQEIEAINEDLRNQVTERELAEKAAQLNELKFRSVVHSANDTIILVDSQGRIVEGNKGLQRVFGYTKAECIGQPFTVLSRSAIGACTSAA